MCICLDFPLQDCFSFLTNPIYNCEADVYQYVGDEAVLIWPLKKGLKKITELKSVLKKVMKLKKVLKKSRIRVTKHLSTDADSSTDTTVGWTKNSRKPNFFEKRKKSSKMQKLKNA